MDFRDELGRISLPDTVRVPTPFQANVQHVDALADTSFMSIYGEAQAVLRQLAEAEAIWGHAARQEYAERTMGLVDPYLLCRQGIRSVFAPDELLKLLYLLGQIDPRGTVQVRTEQALSPPALYVAPRPSPVPLGHPQYWDWRTEAELADIQWWRDRRGEHPDWRQEIFGLQQEFMALKYGTHIRQHCEPLNHHLLIWRQEMKADDWWREDRRTIGL